MNRCASPIVHAIGLDVVTAGRFFMRCATLVTTRPSSTASFSALVSTPTTLRTVLADRSLSVSSAIHTATRARVSCCNGIGPSDGTMWLRTVRRYPSIVVGRSVSLRSHNVVRNRATVNLDGETS